MAEYQSEFTYTDKFFPITYRSIFAIFSKSNILKHAHHKYKVYKGNDLIKIFTYKIDDYFIGGPTHDIYNEIGGADEPKYKVKQNSNGKFALDIKEEYVKLNSDGTISFVYQQHSETALDTYGEITQIINDKERIDTNHINSNNWRVISFGDFPLKGKRKDDLAKSLADFINDLPTESKLTINDWYNSVDIPMKQRTDFGTAAIFKQINDRDLLKK